MSSLTEGLAASPGLVGVNDFAERIDAIRARAMQKVERVPLPGAPLSVEATRLPLWPQPVRAVPNGFLRSSLFGVIAKGKRRYVQSEMVAAVGGIEIWYSGQRLDQGDLDMWACLLHAVRLQELGSRYRVTSYALLKLMGRSDTGKNRTTLQARIERLVATALTVKQGRYSYIGSLIGFAVKDEEAQGLVIKLDHRMRSLFADDHFTQIEWVVRHDLSGYQIAQWLHGFYASHAKPFPLKVETLHKLCGSEMVRMDHFREKLRKALSALAEASAARGVGFSYEIRGDLVHVEKEASGTQQRHLAKKAVKPRGPRN